MDYHIRYGHMGAMKVVKALEEQVYILSLIHICVMRGRNGRKSTSRLKRTLDCNPGKEKEGRIVNNKRALFLHTVSVHQTLTL